MKKENFMLYFSTFISGVLITMFISALVTYLAILDVKVFFEVFKKYCFYPALVAFPTILFVRPISVKVSNEVSNFIYK